MEAFGAPASEWSNICCPRIESAKMPISSMKNMIKMPYSTSI